MKNTIIICNSLPTTKDEQTIKPSIKFKRNFVFLDAFSSLPWNNLLMGDKMEGHVSIPDRTSYSRSNRPFSHFQRRLGTMTSPISDVTLDVEARIEKNACNQNQRSCTPNLKQCLEATERCTITEHGALQGNEVWGHSCQGNHFQEPVLKRTWRTECYLRNGTVSGCSQWKMPPPLVRRYSTSQRDV